MDQGFKMVFRVRRDQGNDTFGSGVMMEIKKEIISVMGDFMAECARLPMASRDADTIEIVKLIMSQIKTATLLVKTVNAYEGRNEQNDKVQV